MGSMDENHSHRKWSDLLNELLSKIWQQHVDPPLQSDVRRRMRAVCTTWRASVPLTTPIPNHSANVPSFFDVSYPDTAFYFVENTFYHITPLANPKSPWLVRVEERGRNLYRMRNPFCGSYCLFYMFHPFCITSKIDNLLDYQIREVHRSYTLKRPSPSHPHVLFQLQPRQQKPIRKVTTSNVNDFITGFTLLALSFGGFLFFWRMGDNTWTKLAKFCDDTCKVRLVETVVDEIGDGKKFALFVDIAIHKGKIYTIEKERGYVYVIDMQSIAANTIRPFMVEARVCFTPSQIIPTQFMIDRGCFLTNCALVENNGVLYYVFHVRHENESNQCQSKRLFVLKDDQDESRWETVEPASAMHGQVIFLLDEASFVVPEAEGLGEGGIFSTIKYVPGNLMHRYERVHFPFDGCFQKCAFRKAEAEVDEDEDVDSNSSSDDDCSSIFFPPPPWLKSYYRKQGNAPVIFSELFG